MEAQELVTIVPWTFIAQICNLFIQMYLIKRFLFKPISEILEKRKNMADKEIKEARESRAEADGLKEKYETSLADAHEEAARIVADAQREAQNKADTLIKDAENDAVALRRRAAADIEQERRKAINEVKNEIGGLAMDIAGKVVEKEIKENDHRQLIDSFIDRMGEAS